MESYLISISVNNFIWEMGKHCFSLGINVTRSIKLRADIEGLIIVYLYKVYRETLWIGTAGTQGKQFLWGERVWTPLEEVGVKKTTRHKLSRMNASSPGVWRNNFKESHS